MRKKKITESFPKIIFGFIASFTVILLVGIFLFLFLIGIGTFAKVPLNEFLFGNNWNPTGYYGASWGILSLLTGTGIIAVLSLLIAIPFGLSIAIYLSEVAPRNLKEFVKPLIEMIASIPTVVLGLLGLLYLSPLVAKVFHLSNGLNALSASFLVAVVTVPTIASICEDALSSVDQKYREASLALGATKWITIKKVVIPAAGSGLLAGIMLGLGRVIGETMIVLMVAGNSRVFPGSILDPVRPMTAAIAIDIKEVVFGSLHWQSLFAIGFILFILTFLINFIADIFIHKSALK